MNTTIGDIDPNLHIESSLNLPGIVWRSARTEPFQLYGLYAPQSEGGFRRMPEAVARQTNSGVAALYANTAGGRLRFRTDSRVVALKAVMPNLCVMQHIPLPLFLRRTRAAALKASFAFPTARSGTS